MAKMKKNNPKIKERTPMDWKLVATLSGVAIVVILAVWAYRLPLNYLNMYVGHYEGTSDIIAAVKPLQYTDEEKRAMMELQEAYDDFSQQQIGHTIVTEGNDGIKLSSSLYNQGSDVTVILLHSFDETRNSDQLLAPYFYNKGYNVVIPDLRKHGDSEGEYVSWGVNESQDLLAVIEDIIGRYGTDSQIILYGNLLGAGTELMASNDLPDQVKFIIAEDAYNNLNDLAKHYMSSIIHAPGVVMAPMMNYFSKRNYEFDFASCDVTAAVSDQIPVLLIYGSEDQLITEAMQQELANALGDSGEILTIEGGRYGTNYAIGQELYEQTIEQYIDQYIK